MRNLTIRARIILLISIAVAFAALVGGGFYYQLQELRKYSITQTQNVMLEGQKDKLSVLVNALAVEIAEDLKGQPADKAIIVDTVRKITSPIRFEADESGYIFVYEGTVNVSFPVNLKNQGKDLGELKDANGLFMIKALDEAAHKGGGFVTYIFDKPGKGLTPKLSYATMIPGTNFWIGTGVYLDNIDVEKARIDGAISGMVKTATLTIAGIVLALLLLVVLPLSVLIFRSIILPLNAATKAAQDVAGGDLDVSLTVAGRDETSRLETALNTMVATLRTNMAQIKVKT
ncbi:MAG: chemotaxis protein, partial [Deltaproteobacteria bacterium HGW-Deltaproteobacteria-8]